MINRQSLRLTVGATHLEPVSVARDPYGRLELGALKQQLMRIKSNLPANVAITLQTDDDVRYDDLVRVIDECIGDGLPVVQVSPALG